LSDHVPQNININIKHRNYEYKQRIIYKYNWPKIENEIINIDIRNFVIQNLDDKIELLLNQLEDIENQNRWKQKVNIECQSNLIISIRISKLVSELNCQSASNLNYKNSQNLHSAEHF